MPAPLPICDAGRGTGEGRGGGGLPAPAASSLQARSGTTASSRIGATTSLRRSGGRGAGGPRSAGGPPRRRPPSAPPLSPLLASPRPRNPDVRGDPRRAGDADRAPPRLLLFSLLCALSGKLEPWSAWSSSRRRVEARAPLPCSGGGARGGPAMLRRRSSRCGPDARGCGAARTASPPPPHRRPMDSAAPGEDGTGEFVGVGGSWTRGGASRGIEELLDSSESRGTRGRRENPVSVPVARYSSFFRKSSRETNRGSFPVPRVVLNQT
jgi:hypothetical protein